MKEVDLDEPTLFLDHVYFGCTQRDCKPTDDIFQHYNEVSESHISAGATEKLPGWDRLHAKTMVWSHDIEGHAQKVCGKVLRTDEKRRQSNFTHFPVLAWMITNSRRKIWNQLGNHQKFDHKCFFKCLFLARIGRPDIPCSVNKLAPSGTKWTQACDKRLARLISYIHHTRDYRQCCHAGNAAQHCRLGLFQDSDGDFEHSKSTSGGILCIFGCRTCVSFCWMCKKQTSVSHSSTE